MSDYSARNGKKPEISIPVMQLAFLLASLGPVLFIVKIGLLYYACADGTLRFDGFMISQCAEISSKLLGQLVGLVNTAAPVSFGGGILIGASFVKGAWHQDKFNRAAELKITVVKEKKRS